MIATTRTGADWPLRIAIPKGSLFAEGVKLFARAGLDTDALASPGRQLIISAPDIEFIIAKPTDVPVYVAYGAADCGIAGKDVLVESALEVVELVDLHYGACRFVVAGREERVAMHERYGHLGVLRVATKYPGITQAHFDAAGTQVEIVRLNGNIELAPLIGISDVIVDITATGTTLRENGLHIIDEVMASTARFVGNPVSVRTDARVTALADVLSELTVESKFADTTAPDRNESENTR